jgi:hypothetical protein
VVGSRRVSRDARGARDAGLNVRVEREGNEVGGLPLREIALALWADLRMVRPMETPCQNTERLDGRASHCCNGALPQLAV